ncbi:MAG TPA: hypothetical protein VE420_07355 [Gemmatimonadales bacterium]|nr:hypothetical protein [Gemmatimonadales bacterium]
MSRSLTVLTSAFASALVLGCNDRPTPSEPVDQPSFRTEQNPDGSGAFVVHFEEGAFGFVDDDPAPGLSILIGWTLEELNLFCTTEEITRGSLKVKLVLRPDGSLIEQVHGAHIPLLVWESDTGDICALRQEPHYTGTGQVSTTDNDRFTSGNRTNSAHVGIHGQVTSETGDRFQLLGQWHAKILRGSTEQVDRSDFRLIPIGR